MTSATYQVLFCEDIRKETGGKDSYMGVFNDVLLGEGFPILLPKLVCVIIFETSANRKKLSDTVSFHLNGEEIAAQDIEIENRTKFSKRSNWQGRINIIFSPFIFEDEGKIEVFIGRKDPKLIGDLVILRNHG